MGREWFSNVIRAPTHEWVGHVFLAIRRRLGSRSAAPGGELAVVVGVVGGHQAGVEGGEAGEAGAHGFGGGAGEGFGGGLGDGVGEAGVGVGQGGEEGGLVGVAVAVGRGFGAHAAEVFPVGELGLEAEEADAVVVGPGHVTEEKGGVVHHAAGDRLGGELVVGDVVDELIRVGEGEVVGGADQVEEHGGVE